jgi:MFS family permease
MPTRKIRRMPQRPLPLSRMRAVFPAAADERIYAVATLIDSAGTGLFLVTSAVFLTRYADQSPGEVGTGLTIAGLAAIGASVPAGRLAEAIGYRNTLIALNCIRGLLFAGYLLIHSFPIFLAIAIPVAVADASANICRSSYLSWLFGSRRRSAVGSYNRAVFNAGISLGSIGAGVALGIGTRSAFATLILGDALSYVLVALILCLLPGGSAGPKSISERSTPGKIDTRRLRSFVTLSLLCGVSYIGDDVILLALPLWIVRRTHVPRPAIAALLIINTALIVAFQVRASRNTDNVPGAARAGRLGGAAMLLGCAVCAVTGGLPRWPALVLLIMAVLFITIGEMLGSAATWGIAYGLSAGARRGTYLGVWGAGNQAASVGGPALATGLAVACGSVGWLALGAIFLAAGAAQVPMSSHALRETSGHPE